jgi:hypothetical protein
VKNQPQIKALMEEYARDPDPLNVLEEVALARALLHDRLDRMHKLTCPICKRPPDEESLPGLIELVSRAVGRIEQARSQKSITVVELVNLVNRLALVVKHHVRDRDTLEAIANEWESLAVSTTDTSRAR